MIIVLHYYGPFRPETHGKDIITVWSGLCVGLLAMSCYLLLVISLHISIIPGAANSINLRLSESIFFGESIIHPVSASIINNGLSGRPDTKPKPTTESRDRIKV